MMDGSSKKKMESFQTLDIRNKNDVYDLKANLNEIISTGKDHNGMSSHFKSLITHPDQEIVLLSVHALSELAKCEEKREMYADKEIIAPILEILNDKITTEKLDLVKQCCRALGNMCCDFDCSRQIILDCDGVPVLIKVLKLSVEMFFSEIRNLMSKTLLNFAIGGRNITDALIKGGLTDLLCKILNNELKKDDLDDGVVTTTLLLLSVISDNTPEFLYDEQLNVAILKVLKESNNIDISELCLDHLYSQAQHDSVKILMANQGGVQLVCSRLEQLMQKQDADDLNVSDSEVEAIVKEACDLLIIILTGDEAMHILYNNGVGEVYLTMVKWLDSSNYNILTTAVLAIGNFARKDEYCIQMMENGIYDKLLDLFETYHTFAVRMKKEPDNVYPIDCATVTKIQHALLSSLRNLTVAVENKRVAAAKGRAAPLLLNALPHVEDHHVAYKLLAAIRMLVDKQEGVARQVALHGGALRVVAAWGAGPAGGAAHEAPRLLAWTARQLRATRLCRHLVQVEGCVASLVNMLVSSHWLMQNEAIVALTLLAIEAMNKAPLDQLPEFDFEKSFITQLIDSEIGKHVSILVDTNCAKMPVEVAENLMAFLDLTSKMNKIALDYKDAKVQDSLKKFSEARRDFSEDLRKCVSGIIAAISDNGKD